MEGYGFTRGYLTKDGAPWFPIMGEIHYSRYPDAYWKESIYKMKAGGVDIVSCYVFWIHHEEGEGEFDFTGQRNLRKFIETVKECGLKLFLRIGPWAHGEVRNGGFPDWVIKKHGDHLRTNDPAYLADVEKFWKQVFTQSKGLMFEDGGPVIGLQIENEFGHAGGMNGEQAEEHMKILTQMAKEIGFHVPYYTATGWGGAVTGGLLPVMGGYCDAPWSASQEKLPPSGNYVFTPERNDHNIGTDLGLGSGLTFDMTEFPFLTAELGGGLQVTHHRRPVAIGPDIGAMSLAKLGSGVVLLGYYMYHGGTNPDGRYSTLQESKATGYPNDLPVKSYDFNAPIHEYGQLSHTWREIRLLANFIHDFGEELCLMPAVFPEDNPTDPMNLKDLRTSLRYHEANGLTSGYLFVNNYQRLYAMARHDDVVLRAELPDETIIWDSMNIADREFFFLPFNMRLNETALLKSSSLTPLCRLESPEGVDYVFYGDHTPVHHVEGDLGKTRLINLTKREALMAAKIHLDRDYLFISHQDIIPMEDGIHLFGREEVASFKTYPPLTKAPSGFFVEYDGGFATYQRRILSEKDSCEVIACELIDELGSDVRAYRIAFPNIREVKAQEGICDVFLQIRYSADRLELYLDDQLCVDHFYTGQIYDMGLKRFDFPEELVLKLYPLDVLDPVYLENWPATPEGFACRLDHLSTMLQWELRL